MQKPLRRLSLRLGSMSLKIRSVGHISRNHHHMTWQCTQARRIQEEERGEADGEEAPKAEKSSKEEEEEKEVAEVKLGGDGKEVLEDEAVTSKIANLAVWIVPRYSLALYLVFLTSPRQWLKNLCISETYLNFETFLHLWYLFCPFTQEHHYDIIFILSGWAFKICKKTKTPKIDFLGLGWSQHKSISVIQRTKCHPLELN